MCPKGAKNFNELQPYWLQGVTFWKGLNPNFLNNYCCFFRYNLSKCSSQVVLRLRSTLGKCTNRCLPKQTAVVREWPQGCSSSRCNLVFRDESIVPYWADQGVQCAETRVLKGKIELMPSPEWHRQKQRIGSTGRNFANEIPFRELSNMAQGT